MPFSVKHQAGVARCRLSAPNVDLPACEPYCREQWQCDQHPSASLLMRPPDCSCLSWVGAYCLVLAGSHPFTTARAGTSLLTHPLSTTGVDAPPPAVLVGLDAVLQNPVVDPAALAGSLLPALLLALHLEPRVPATTPGPQEQPGQHLQRHHEAPGEAGRGGEAADGAGEPEGGAAPAAAGQAGRAAFWGCHVWTVGTNESCPCRVVHLEPSAQQSPVGVCMCPTTAV